MSSAGLNPLPPHIQHSTTRLTHLEAHTLLSTFLERAENDAAYRPDSTLTERGPQALSSGSTPNLTLSHLQRILKGVEGKRVGGGLKALNKEGNNAGENVNGEEGFEGTREIDGESQGIVEDENVEMETPKQQKKGKRRSLDPDLSLQTPKPKKQKQSQKVLATPNVERTDDPTSDAVLAALSDPDDWQDPDTFALAQNEVNTNDAGPTDALAQDDLDFQDLEAGNDVEEDRNPSAALPQPHSAKQEKELVSIQLERSGEVVDPRETPTSMKSKKQSKKEKRKAPAAEEQTSILEDLMPDVEKSEKKKKKKSKDKDAAEDAAIPIRSSPLPQDTEHAEVERSEKKKKKKSKLPPSSREILVASSPPVQNNLSLSKEEKKPKKKPKAQPPSSEIPVASSPPTQNSPALSKAEKKKLKKARHMESKKVREEDRIRKKDQ
ncbi:hypothetical protein H2200_009117 [Cladophialophora chaetospira]|uniref:Uncharacterized protein n=1 Tax=Cladophialophora chaetospira TaxID=386627 RepID=A0AA38X3I0_9EURO|nr:hypothetical protein H2200_009117 [Cladophialophora chaetospira]